MEQENIDSILKDLHIQNKENSLLIRSLYKTIHEGKHNNSDVKKLKRHVTFMQFLSFVSVLIALISLLFQVFKT